MTDPGRWLIVLGSNAPDAASRLDAALAAIGSLGAVVRQTRRIRSDDISGRGPRYLNQLAWLDAGPCAAELVAELKRIERAAGRTPQRVDAGTCDLDLDLLARVAPDGIIDWLTGKPVGIPAVRTLLEESGL